MEMGCLERVLNFLLRRKFKNDILEAKDYFSEDLKENAEFHESSISSKKKCECSSCVCLGEKPPSNLSLDIKLLEMHEEEMRNKGKKKERSKKRKNKPKSKLKRNNSNASLSTLSTLANSMEDRKHSEFEKDLFHPSPKSNYYNYTNEQSHVVKPEHSQANHTILV